MNDVALAQARGWRATYLNRSGIGFLGMHLVALAGVIALGWSWGGLALAVALYVPRIFFVTGGYHRYFSHRSYKTSRAMQAVLAFGAESTAQKGVLWWAAHHRHQRDPRLRALPRAALAEPVLAGPAAGGRAGDLRDRRLVRAGVGLLRV